MQARRLRVPGRLGHNYWLTLRGPTASSVARSLDPYRALRALREAVGDGALSLARILDLLGTGSPFGTTQSRQWSAIERALSSGRLVLVEQARDQRTFIHEREEQSALRPEPAQEPAAIVDDTKSLAIVSCAGQLDTDPLAFRYLVSGLASDAIELRIHVEGLDDSIVHRRMLDASECSDGPHDGSWDGEATHGSLAGARVPPSLGPCRVELFASEIYRDQAPFALVRPPVSVVRIDGDCFASGHALLLPDVQPGEGHVPGRTRRSALVALAFVLRRAHAEDFAELSIAGHTDSVGSSSANQTLSEARAENVALYLGGDGPGWASHCEAHAEVADDQRALAWIGRRFGEDYDCDPGPIDGVVGPRTRDGLAAFRTRWSELEGAELPDGDRLSVSGWEALYSLYDRALDELLGDELGLDQARASVQLCSLEHPGYGETFPRDGTPIDDRASADDRRVELVGLSEPALDFVGYGEHEDPGGWLYGERPCVVRTELEPELDPAATLTVVALDARGPVLPGVALELTDLGGSVYEGLSDEDGRQVFAGLAPGAARLGIVELDRLAWPPSSEAGASEGGDPDHTLTLSLVEPQLPSLVVELDTSIEIVLDPPTFHQPEPRATLFDVGSALLVPGSWTDGRHPLADLVHCLVSLLDFDDRVLFVVAHASAPGSQAANQTLSEQRRDGLRALVDNDEQAWVDIAKDASSHRDVIAYLDYLGARRGWSCAYSSEVADAPEQPDDASAACIEAFQADYNERFEGELAVDGVCGPKTLGAMFAVVRDEFERWLDKLGAGADDLPLERIHYRAYGDELAERDADPTPEQCAAAQRLDLLLYETGEARDEPEALALAELYDRPYARRVALVLPDEPHEWARGPLRIVSDLSESEDFEPETYRLAADDESVLVELVIPDHATIVNREYVLEFSEIPTDKRYTLTVVAASGQQSVIFEQLSYGQLHGAHEHVLD